MSDHTTREFCQRCQRISPVGFFSPTPMWEVVAGSTWRHSILCLSCFAALGDEKHARWEEGIQFFPVSYATHHERRQAVEPEPEQVDAVALAREEAERLQKLWPSSESPACLLCGKPWPHTHTAEQLAEWVQQGGSYGSAHRPGGEVDEP